jgi:hypothetical protein
MTDPAAIVEQYFAVVADLGTSQDDLVEVLDPSVRIIEHPTR